MQPDCVQVDLVGQAAWLTHDVPAPVAEALERCGALVERAAGGDAYAALSEAVPRLGRLDIVVAGVSDEIGKTSRLLGAAARAMGGGGGGRIIVLFSVGGAVVQRGAAEHAALHAAHAALTRALALDCAAQEVRVNGIAAGAIANAQRELGARESRMLSHVPLARAGTQDELVGPVLFLADPENSYMTGHILSVDGGWSAGYGRDF